MFDTSASLQPYLRLTFQPRVNSRFGAETEHPVGCLLMHVPDSWRQAHVHRLKEFALVALLLDGLQ